MLKYLLPFFIILSSCSSWSQKIESPSTMREDFFVFEAKNWFETLYDSGTTKSIQEYYMSGSIIFNGSYFGWTKPWEYYPAGYWEKNGQMGIIPELWKQLLPIYDDPNITHFVWLSGSEIKIFKNNRFKENAGPYDSAFQAWPLVLSENTQQKFWNSWHANWKHERTLIGITQSGKIYFFVSTLPRSLWEIWEKILQDNRFIKDPITVLNLDGWPSTAYFDGRNGFHTDKKLPIILRTRL